MNRITERPATENRTAGRAPAPRAGSRAAYPPGTRRCRTASPVGALTLLTDDAGRLLRIAFEDDDEPFDHLPEVAPARVPAVAQLEEYFAGGRRRFALALAPAGTAFQQRVWRALLEIPHGETLSYGALAARLGAGAHARAVGAANGRNPIPVIIPCHRVIGADGRLTGYGGGLGRKRRLLALEGATWRE